MTNEELAFEVVKAAWRAGCREFVLCAGSRNSPLVLLLLKLEQEQEELKVWNFFDERSAAFFALGRSKISGAPSSVVTTSGTAAAELLPAVIESHYSDIPLILITADRPGHFRYSGAPQAIDQIDLLKPYAETFVAASVDDLDGLESLDASEMVQRRWHINVSFDEPLLSSVGFQEYHLHALREPAGCGFSIAESELALVKEFIKDREGLVVLAGGLKKEQQNEALADWLEQLGCPVWADAGSGLREHRSLSSCIIRSGDLFFSENRPIKVLRIGAVPSLRFWRDLENMEELAVLSIDPPTGYPGLGRDSLTATGRLADFVEEVTVDSNLGSEMLVKEDESWLKIEKLLTRYPLSELACFRALSENIPSQSLVFLGNSMPIREWDLVASYEQRDLHCFACRGANGIDGQLSAFLGMAANEGESWGLFGDLTTLYDMSAPWVMDQLPSGKRRLVVINNGGGRIFSRLPHLANLPDAEKKVTENSHNLNFGHWAAMWGFAYHQVQSLADLSMDVLSRQDSAIIELCPDAEQTQAFWEEYKSSAAQLMPRKHEDGVKRK